MMVDDFDLALSQNFPSVDKEGVFQQMRGDSLPNITKVPSRKDVADLCNYFRGIITVGQESGAQLPDRHVPVSYTHLTLPTNREV